MHQQSQANFLSHLNAMGVMSLISLAPRFCQVYDFQVSFLLFLPKTLLYIFYWKIWMPSGIWTLNSYKHLNCRGIIHLLIADFETIWYHLRFRVKKQQWRLTASFQNRAFITPNLYTFVFTNLNGSSGPKIPNSLIACDRLGLDLMF